MSNTLRANTISHWKEALRSHFGNSVYQDWLEHLELLTFNNGVLVLSCPSRFVKDWIETHYLDLMKPLLCRDVPGCSSIQLEERVTSSGSLLVKEWSPSLSIQSEDDSDISSITLVPCFTFDQFVVGKPNEFAYAAARRVAESDETIYNPLFLYGPVGHGKTHLMHSIAHTITQRSNGQKKILYLSAEKFMYYFVRA